MIEIQKLVPEARIISAHGQMNKIELEDKMLSFVNHEYDVSYDDILTLVVFRDAEGNVINTMSHTRAWINMWYQGFGKLDLPSLPTAVGEYSLEVYYNGALVTTQAFTIALPEIG